MSRLLLVRHGESTWNAACRWQGRADPPLSPRGEAQAGAAGPAVARVLGAADAVEPAISRGVGTATEAWSRSATSQPDPAPPDHDGARAWVACSPLVRAHRTAELLAAAVGLGAPTPAIGLEERGAGPWTGLTHAEIDSGWPGARQDRWRPDGFESDASLLARATAALVGVDADAGGRPALVVAHEGVIRALERARGHDDGKLHNLGARWFVLRDGVPEPDGPRLALLPHR